jgi:hypothetical protein
VNKKWIRAALDQADARAQEEMGELNAALGKAGCFGWLSRHPDEPDGETNLEWALRQCDDAIDSLVRLKGELNMGRNGSTRRATIDAKVQTGDTARYIGKSRELPDGLSKAIAKTGNS